MPLSYMEALRSLEQQQKILYARDAEQASFGPSDPYAHFKKPNSSGDGIDVCNTNRLHPLCRGFCLKYGHLMTGVVSNWGAGAGVETSELADVCPNANRILAVGGTPFDTSRLLQHTYTEICSLLGSIQQPLSLLKQARADCDDTLDLDRLLGIQESSGLHIFRPHGDSEKRIEQWIGEAPQVIDELFNHRNPELKLDLQYDNVGAQYYWMLENRATGKTQYCLDFVSNRMSREGCVFWAQMPLRIDEIVDRQHALAQERILISSSNMLLAVAPEGEIGTDLLKNGFEIGLNNNARNGAPVYRLVQELRGIAAA